MGKKEFLKGEWSSHHEGTSVKRHHAFLKQPLHHGDQPPPPLEDWDAPKSSFMAQKFLVALNFEKYWIREYALVPKEHCMPVIYFPLHNEWGYSFLHYLIRTLQNQAPRGLTNGVWEVGGLKQ